MDRTPLTACLGQEAADRSCQACVLIGDHELDTAEAAVLELLEEFRPALLRLLSAQRDGQEPSVTLRAHCIRHERTHVLDFAGPAGVQERGVQVQIGVRPLDRRTAQPFHGLVEPFCHTTHRRAPNTLAHQRLGDVAHLAL